ncbi:MAG: penicillin-binding transpeptidase domain-containing protein [Bdellovibrionia bacterium]
MNTALFSRKMFWGLIVLTSVNLFGALFVMREEGVASIGGWFSKSKVEVAERFGPLFRDNKYPSDVEWTPRSGERTKVQYTFDSEIQAKVQGVFDRHRPDYGSAVAIDAVTGEILTMVSYTRSRTAGNLALKGTFPAASIFKIVTAAAALDNKKLSPDSRIAYGGGNHTMYKKNVEQERGRWMRWVTLKDAFARSINTVFAKVGVNIGSERLSDYAERFKFNVKIDSDVPVENGYAFIPNNDDWAVAEAASGFTRKNTMSPLQGALMAAAIANDGSMPHPYLIRSLTDAKGKVIYKGQPVAAEPVVDESTVNQMRRLMSATITQGTSRKSFRSIVQGARIAGLELGGKTGSLTGTAPRGKYDWFVGYGRMGGRKIAIAVVTINERVWRVRSSQVAADFFRHYFKISTARAVASFSKKRPKYLRRGS